MGRTAQLIFIVLLVQRTVAIQEFVAESFSSFDFDSKHSISFKQLLFVLLGFLATFGVLLIVVFLFHRCMEKLGYNDNTKRFELPSFENYKVVEEDENENKRKSFQSILVHSELIKMQGDEEVLSPLGLDKKQRRELAMLLGGYVH